MNVTSAVRQAVERTSWFKKRQRYRVLYWREISPLAVPILLENACVLLMGVLSTFLVSWLGKEAMAGVGLADSFNMVIMSFFAAIDLGTTVVVAFSLGKRDRRRARAAARQSLAIMTLFSILLAGVIHAFGQEIIDFVAGDATAQVKDLALTYLELTALSYPAAAIALIGSGALRGAGTTKIPLLINGGMNILNILISSFAIIWEVMGIGIPASIESVLFNGGKLLTQMFVAGMGTNVIAGNFIAFSVASLINLPGNALGSASTIITGKRLGKGQIGQAEFQAWHVFWLSTIILTLIAWGSAPFAGFIASFYTHEEDVKEVVKQLLWLNALFMPIWSLSWTLPCAFKGARDVRYTMWVSMLGMWGCRVVAGYTLGIVLEMGVIGVWLGMVLDWAVRGVLFYFRMVSGRWLWKYPRVKASSEES
ncbi:MAG: MATE family efflux transporter [Klebsiella pneumoniae]|nr:MATE family efflux transporter [Klebsiella pneumoniae]